MVYLKSSGTSSAKIEKSSEVRTVFEPPMRPNAGASHTRRTGKISGQ